MYKRTYVAEESVQEAAQACVCAQELHACSTTCCFLPLAGRLFVGRIAKRGPLRGLYVQPGGPRVGWER